MRVFHEHFDDPLPGTEYGEVEYAVDRQYLGSWGTCLTINARTPYWTSTRRLSDTSQRIHFLKRKPKDWDSFFADAKDDAVLDEGLAVATTLAADHEIVYLTGRPERLRRDTVKWLKDNGFPEGSCLMRRNNDRRAVAVMKLDRLRTLAAGAPGRRPGRRRRQGLRGRREGRLHR